MLSYVLIDYISKQDTSAIQKCGGHLYESHL